MSTHRPDRLDRFTAERLLRGERIDADQAGTEQLADLIAAAAAPAEAGELAGEEAAVAAFREARLVPALQQRRRSMIKVALAKALTLKVGLVAVTATAAATGGVTLAASTGHLPAALGGTKPVPSHTPGDHKLPHPGKTPGMPDGVAMPSGMPSPSLAGLCKAFEAHQHKLTIAKGEPSPNGDRKQAEQAARMLKEQTDKALDAPAFKVLISKAGDKDKVAAFCAALEKAEPPKVEKPSLPQPPTTRPTDMPTNMPTKLPHGVPTQRPTGMPSIPTGH